MKDSGPLSAAVQVEASSDAWLSVSDSLLHGVNHALSNRLAALGAVARILERGDAGRDPLIDILIAEVSQIETVAGLLHLLPRDRGADAEPVHLPDLLGDAIALHQLQGPLRDTTYEIVEDAGALPVWAERWALVHSLLILLSAAARAAQLRGGRHVVVRYGGDEAYASLCVEAPLTEGEINLAGGQHEELLDAVDTGAVAELLKASDGTLIVDESGNGSYATRFEIRLPTLVEARKREQR
jgi:hypothetical protein